MREIGSAAMPIIPTFDGLQRQLENGTARPLAAAGDRGGQQFGDAAGRSAGKRFGSIFSTAAKASLVGVAGAGALAFKVGADSIGLASDLGESLNAVNVSYGKQAKAVKALGRESADSIGLSNEKFNSLAVRFSSFSKTIAGGPGRKVVTTLDDLTTRAADFASVMNLEVADAAQIFQSGLSGEAEPLKAFGIDMSGAAVEAFALAEGIQKGKTEFTEAEKIQARYGLLMQQTANTQDDFSNTSDSLANRQRILTARWDDARAKLGTALLPMLEDVAGFILNKGLPAFEDLSDWFVTKGVPAFQDFIDEARPLAESLLPAIGDAAGTVRDALSAAAPYAKDLVDAFNDMPEWAKTALVGGALAGGAASKFGLLPKRGAAGGAADAILGKGNTAANPLFVWVVNGVGAGLGPKAGPKVAGPKVPPAVPVGALAVPLVGAAVTAPDVFGTLFGSDERNIRKAAEDFGFDMERLAADMDSSAEGGAYLREFMALLRDKASPGALQEVAGFFNPTITDNERASTALRVLEKEFPTAAIVDLKRVPLGARPLSKMLGTDAAKRDLADLRRMIQDLPNVGITPNGPLPGLPGTGTYGGPAVPPTGGGPRDLGMGGSTNGRAISYGPNYYGDVTLTDDKEARRNAQERHRRANSDGARRR